MDKKVVPVGISNRHLHVKKEDLEKLFGAGYELTVKKDLSQRGQYACEETVTITGPKGSIPNVRILGPCRTRTQVEISKTDSFVLGVAPPVRDSGELDDSAPVKITGPKGEVELKEGLILAKRHVHFSTEDAKEFNVVDRQIITIETTGERAVTYKEVLARVHDTYALEFHLDTDEANCVCLNNGDMVTVII